VASNLAGEDDGRLYLHQLTQTVVLVLTCYNNSVLLLATHAALQHCAFLALVKAALDDKGQKP